MTSKKSYTHIQGKKNYVKLTFVIMLLPGGLVESACWGTPPAWFGTSFHAPQRCSTAG